MSIRELIEATIEVVSNYRYPNTSEFRTVINPILKAAGVGELLEGDRIDGLDIDEDALNISFSYSRMQCEMSGDRHLPLSVLDAEDPIAAATAWRLDQAVAAAEKLHAEAVRLLERRTLSLEEAKTARGDAATVPQDIGRDAALADVIRKYWAGDCFKGISKSEAAEINQALAATPPANVAQAAPQTEGGAA